jgi:hypothetical protein
MLLLFPENRMEIPVCVEEKGCHSVLPKNLLTVGVCQTVLINSPSLCCSRRKGVSFSKSTLYSPVVKQPVHQIINLTSCETICRFCSFNRSPSVTVKQKIVLKWELFAITVEGGPRK